MREARDHLRAVTDSMGEALCTLDDAGHVSYMNPAAERMLGWSIDEMRGRTLHEATHYRRPDGSPYPIDDCPLYGGHRAREAVRVDDDMFVRRDGSCVDVSWVLTPFHSPTGANSVVVFSDNTVAKAAQQRLHGEIERLSQVRDLHEALQEQRFELFAQPIIDVASGTVMSHELLLRMRERDGGIRTPGSFLAVAESCGLILEIDRWVVGEAARLAGDGHQVELNLSATSLDDPALFEHLADALTSNDADPSLIVIELTETALMQEEAIARTFVQRVRAMGCEVALDDFGTGFGGFGYLKRLPVDYLKIDIEFVRDLCTSAASQHVVKAVVGLAQAFGQRTIAEGVEDDQTLEMVRAMGVDYAQGFGIGCPAPLSEMLPDTSSIAAERDRAGAQRDHAGVQRDLAAVVRDRAAAQRDDAGVQRDLAGVVRDRAGMQRDHAGVQRDLAGVTRDRAGAQRDHAAEQRDRAAEQSEASPGAQIMEIALQRSARARQDAARDRRRSRQDRRAGASERSEAELDRGTALADRRAGASERDLAGSDRDTALADRGAGASERTEAELDRDTALTNRGASAKERDTSSRG
ncbi:MAG TPA: EAL domain-containing protein [Solirubrobacteraceae bacterium]|nr:EAL domain-containing protein [Solirubrobacteraceae bacterium]